MHRSPSHNRHTIKMLRAALQLKCENMERLNQMEHSDRQQAELGAVVQTQSMSSHLETAIINLGMLVSRDLELEAANIKRYKDKRSTEAV